MILDILDYTKGCIIGIGQVAIGHPFDTMKVIIQNENNKTINKINNKTINKINNRTFNKYQYLRGIKYPFILSTFSNAGLFGIYTTLTNNGYGKFESGFASGAIMSLVMNPFEFWKVQAQSNLNQYKINKSLSFKEKFKLSYSGMKYMTPREAIGNGLYFYSYSYYHDIANIGPFIAGGLAGSTSWIATYALDTLKTRKQANPSWTFKQCYNSGSLYKGLSVCLCRAFLVNGISFLLYDFLYNK